MKYVVIQRFDTVSSKFIAVIMILEDKDKADKLAEFLNTGEYFESPVTVESYDSRLPNGTILSILERTI
jgi:hypothetical protein